MKKTFAAILTFVLILTLCACGRSGGELRFGVLNGPTGIGAVRLLDQTDSGDYKGCRYTLYNEATDIAAKVVNGELDVCALPTNLAANLYQKTGGKVRVIALNCLGVLYILENGDAVKSVADMKGRTVLCNGQGANPEYVIRYLLKQNGLDPDRDVELIFKDAAEISALMASGKADLCMLPMPAAAGVLSKNQDVRCALDLTAEYAAVTDNGSVLTMGCLVAGADYIEKHPRELKELLDRCRESAAYVTEHVSEAAGLAVKYGLAANSGIAEAAIPLCGICFITGEDIRPSLEGYLQVLYDANAASVGGAMPADDFYYTEK